MATKKICFEVFQLELLICYLEPPHKLPSVTFKLNQIRYSLTNHTSRKL